MARVKLTRLQRGAIAGVIVALGELAAEFFADYQGPVRLVARALAAAFGMSE